jgi:hypothetical protein
LILATGDIQYRWLWGREDIPMIQAGLSIGWGEFMQQPREPRT